MNLEGVSTTGVQSHLTGNNPTLDSLVQLVQVVSMLTMGELIRRIGVATTSQLSEALLRSHADVFGYIDDPDTRDIWRTELLLLDVIQKDDPQYAWHERQARAFKLLGSDGERFWDMMHCG